MDSNLCQRSISSLLQSYCHDLLIMIMTLPYSLSLCDDVVPLVKSMAGQESCRDEILMSSSESCSAGLLTVECAKPLQNLNSLYYTQDVREVYFIVTIMERSLNPMLDGKENTHGITTPERKIYTVEEIAALLNISMKLAYVLVRSGQSRYIRAGRTVRVSKVSFDERLHE